MHFLFEGTLIRASWLWRAPPVSISATRVIATEGSEDGLLVADMGLFETNWVYEFYTGAYGDHQVKLEQQLPSVDLLERAQGPRQGLDNAAQFAAGKSKGRFP